MMASANDVATALVDRVGGLTAMKLQKLVYYCQAWHLVRHGRVLFDEEIQAWREGPVVRSLFDRHRQRYSVSEWPWGNASALDQTERATVDWVIERYNGYSAERLSRMTHHEMPWRVAREGIPDSDASSAPIPPQLLSLYYARQQADADTAVTTATASAALEGVELTADWQATLRDVAEGLTSADDVVAAEIARARRG
jgi:uncharacterized phage-associated protein